MTLVHAVCFGVQWLSAKNVIIKRTQSCSNASVSLFPSISLSYWFLCLALIKIYPFIPVVIMVTFLYVLVSHWKLLDIYSLTNRAKGRETNRTRGRRGAGAGGDGGLLHPSTDPLILLVLIFLLLVFSAAANVATLFLTYQLWKLRFGVYFWLLDITCCITNN